jgi:hypothetical protein
MKKESYPKSSRRDILLVSNNSRAAKIVKVLFDGDLTERPKIIVVVIPPDKGGP